jgi:hypothetical protein
MPLTSIPEYPCCSANERIFPKVQSGQPRVEKDNFNTGSFFRKGINGSGIKERPDKMNFFRETVCMIF